MKTVRTILITAIAGVVLGLCGAARAELPSPVAHWQFDEGAGAVAYDSAGANDGVVYGAQWATGQIGGALNFDGSNDYVEAASTEELKLNLAGSVSAWIKPGGLYRHSIVSKRGSTQPGGIYENYWLTLGTYNQCTFGIADGSNWIYATIPEEALAVDTWQHVAGIWDPCEVKIYLDGRLIDAQPNNTVSDLLRSDACPLRIGYHHVLDGWFFDGLIDDVRIYNVALSNAEVNEVYRPSGEGLVAHWKFDEGSGSTGYDSAGDNDGTIYGATWADGVLGGALDFDGANDYVEAASSDELKLNLAGTVAVWVKPRDLYEQTIVKKQSVSAAGNWNVNYWLVLGMYNRAITIGDGSNYVYASIPEGELVIDAWQHVVGTWDSTAIKIYLDGDLRDTQPNTLSDLIRSDTYPVRIGYETWTHWGFDGLIDDVRIYDVALSAAEVEELYGQEPNDGLAAHWRFDEGSGSTGYDSAGDNDGVIYGAQWADGFVGGALNFDGVDDYMAAPDDPSLRVNQSSSFSVSAWVNPSGGGWLLSKMRANERHGVFGYSLAWEEYTSRFNFIVEKSWSSSSTPLYSSAVAPGTWHHVTIVYDNKDKKIYVNGDLHNSGLFDRDTGITEPDKEFAVGARSWDYTIDGHFEGLIDDVRIYGRALSAAEVLGLYEDATEVPEAEVYHVDESGGSNLNDGLTRATAFATIQKGIDSSLDGGEVLVWPGVYSQPINFLGKAITVRSAGDAAVIEAPGQDAVTFHSGEGAGSVIKNFVIRNSGLCISVNYGSSPTITNLTIADNDFGIAAYEDSNPDISNCILWDNRDGDLWGCQARYSLVEQEIETGPVDSLIAHWKLDEGRGTTAGDSAGDNDGAINGAQWVVGELSGALSLDGIDDCVNVPDADVFDFNEADVSLSMWFKTSVYADQTLMKLRQYDDDPHLEIYNSTTYGNLGTRAMPTGEAGAIVAYNAGRVDDGGWHHAAVSLENGTTGGYKLYLDGTLVGMTTFSGGLRGWNAIAIGNDADGGGWFNGSIDDVRIYNRALSALEAYMLYEMSREGPVAHWKFDEAAGSIAYDSADSYDGVIYGAQWTTGHVGEALDFDGVDDCVVLPNNSPVWLPEYDFAYSLWVWFDTPAGVSGQGTLLDLNCTSSSDPINDIGLAFKRVDSGKIGFYMVTITGGEQALYSNDVFGEGEWRHLVALRDGGTLAIYVNGSLENSATCSASQIDFTGGSYDDDRVSIGRLTTAYNPNGLFFLDGKLDDIRIYDRALNAGEVELVYGGGLIGRDDTATLRPLFADAGAGDYHLLSERGRYWPEHDVWVLDKASSPCIDAGDPTIEPVREPMPNGGAINMGAHGGTEYASMSEWPILSDYDRNGRSDFRDFATFCDEWLMTLPWAQ